MNLSTLDRVKARDELLGESTKYDALIAEIIASVSADAERILNRFTEAKERTVQFDLGSNQCLVQLPAYPVTEVADVHLNEDRVFDADHLVDASDYYAEADTGLLWLEKVYHSGGRGVLQVKFTGGMAVDTAAFVAAYPDIAQAVDEQVAFIWNKRRSVGLAASGAGSSSKTWATQDLLDSTRRVLMSHRRMNS